MSVPDEQTKHLLYHHIRETCQPGTGCPVCTLTMAAVGHYLTAIMYENVTDIPTRAEVLAAAGYCAVHSWLLYDMREGLGVAIMYLDIVRQMANQCAQASRGERGGSRLGRAALFGRTGARPSSVAICPACRERDHYERACMQALLDTIHDRDLQTRLLQAGGLCAHHMHLIDAVPGRAEDRRLLYGVQQQALSALSDDMAEFVRKHDYRFRHETITDEGSSWIRAIEAVTNKRGLV